MNDTTSATMESKVVLYCGFADVMVHSKMTSLNDVRLYNQRMAEYPKMMIDGMKFLRDRIFLARRIRELYVS